MALSSYIPGPKGFRVREAEGGVRRAERPSHAPMFARSHDEDEPGVVRHPNLDEQPHPLPRPVPSRTVREAHAKGCCVETLGVTGAE
jgi:hypothetical protein